MNYYSLINNNREKVKGKTPPLRPRNIHNITIRDSADGLRM